MRATILGIKKRKIVDVERTAFVDNNRREEKNGSPKQLLKRASNMGERDAKIRQSFFAGWLESAPQGEQLMRKIEMSLAGERA